MINRVTRLIFFTVHEQFEQPRSTDTDVRGPLKDQPTAVVPREGFNVTQPVGGVSSQQSLFSTSPQQTSQAHKSEGGSAGSLQQQAQVSVLTDSLEQQESQALQLINSSMGLGQNVDLKA